MAEHHEEHHSKVVTSHDDGTILVTEEHHFKETHETTEKHTVDGPVLKKIHDNLANLSENDKKGEISEKEEIQPFQCEIDPHNNNHHHVEEIGLSSPHGQPDAYHKMHHEPEISDRRDSTGTQMLQSGAMEDPRSDWDPLNHERAGGIHMAATDLGVELEEREIIREELDENDRDKHRKQSNIGEDDASYYSHRHVSPHNRHVMNDVIYHDTFMKEFEKFAETDAEKPFDTQTDEKHQSHGFNESGTDFYGEADAEHRHSAMSDEFREEGRPLNVESTHGKSADSSGHESLDHKNLPVDSETDLMPVKRDSLLSDPKSGSGRSSRTDRSPSVDHVAAPYPRRSGDATGRHVDSDRRKSSAAAVADVDEEHRRSTPSPLVAAGDLYHRRRSQDHSATSPLVVVQPHERAGDDEGGQHGATAVFENEAFFIHEKHAALIAEFSNDFFVILSSKYSSDNLEAKIFDIFKLFDYDGDGSIHVIDLGTVLRCLNLNPTQSDVKMLKDDFNGNEQKIVWSKFYPKILEIMAKEELKPSTEDELITAFSLLDVEKKGFLTMDQLKNYLLNLGEPLSNDEFEQMIGTGSTESDGDCFNYIEYAKRLVSY